ncbi:sirohydrochlorin chelatase [Kocuria sp.]|uniref:sirohydrochlorin chelatase n=1 Tax=Kocuria sp. TaxID=1871328 RepID=UPI0026DDC978|nr:CbiX/SirB N-terminal domain-containing protein [Kocuria sp.]MDO4919647.1 CbiX/SirB N-terminal domain-containing protein [Kocuria sp.]
MNTSEDSSPVLLACAHGTRDPRGQRAVAALVAAVRDALPDTTVVDTWVDVQEPDLDSRTRELAGRDAVVVPLLLSAGYHVFVDMARAVKASPDHRVAAALGPDRRLAVVLARRLTEALRATDAPELGERDRVVMVSAGSSDPRAGRDCEAVARLLAAELGHPVSTAYLSAAEPTLPQAVAAARTEIARLPEPSADDAAGRVLLAPYLLAPGFFHGRTLDAGADVVAQPLLVDPGEVPPELGELVTEHYRQAPPAA